MDWLKLSVRFCFCWPRQFGRRFCCWHPLRWLNSAGCICSHEAGRDEIFHISIDRRNIMQEEVDKLYKRYVLSAPLDYCMRIPYRAEQIWLAIRHALAWHDNPKGDYTVQYDKPLNRSDQPQPMVQLYEAPTEGKPTCDGKCAKCGRC